MNISVKQGIKAEYLFFDGIMLKNLTDEALFAETFPVLLPYCLIPDRLK